MNLIKTGGPLFLFVSLLLVLGISAYFGKSANLQVEGYDSNDGIPDDDYPSYSSSGTENSSGVKGKSQTEGKSQTGGQSQTEGKSQINPISDYYRWLSFWDTVANSDNPQAVFHASNYVQKSSIVPPVCPVCPSCKGGVCNGVCPNCGGYGGSGTQGATGHGFNDYNSYYGGSGRGIPLTNLANNAGAGATRLAEGAGHGAYKLANNAGTAVARGVEGGVDLAKDTVVGAVDLAKDTVGGAVDLAKDTVGGTVDLVKDAGSGVAGLLKRNPTQVNSIQNSGGQYQGYGNENNTNGSQPGNQSLQGIDPYSYNGALANKKPSNYIPITTDFSAFGK